MRVELSRFIEDDLDTIATYIAQDNPARAVSSVKQIRARFHEVGQGPRLFQLRPEIGADARMALVGRYAILFRIVQDAVRIERVIYGGRDLAGILDQTQ